MRTKRDASSTTGLERLATFNGGTDEQTLAANPFSRIENLVEGIRTQLGSPRGNVREERTWTPWGSKTKDPPVGDASVIDNVSIQLQT